MGGSNRSLAELLDALGNQIHRVLASPSDGQFLEHVKTHGLIEEHVPLPLTNRLYKVGYIYSMFRIAIWAVRNRKRLSAIHANATTGVGLAMLAGVAGRVPVVAWIHDPTTSPIRRKLVPITRRLHPRTRWAAVSLVAARVAGEYALVDPDAVKIVPNPIDRRRVLAPPPPAADTLCVGFLGGTSERKGFDMMPEVIEATSHLPLRWKLFIDTDRRLPTAESEVVDRLRGLGGDRVEILPRQPDVRKVYGVCHLVFAPSRHESFCRVVAESMANGIPVAASDLEPIRDLLGNDEAGLLFPAGDSRAAVEAISSLAGDASLRTRLGEEGKKRSAPFEPATVARAMLELYGVGNGTPEQGTVPR